MKEEPSKVNKSMPLGWITTSCQLPSFCLVFWPRDFLEIYFSLPLLPDFLGMYRYYKIIFEII